MNRRGPEAFDGFPKDPFGTPGIGETFQERPAAVNWGNSRAIPAGTAWTEVLDFRYPGEPRCWAVWLQSDQPGTEWRVTKGAGGASAPPAAAVNDGGYLTAGQSVKIEARHLNGCNAQAFVAHGTGGVPNL